LDILTILFPFILSFDKKVGYYRTWKAVGLALLIIGLPFIVWDVWFTGIGVWGFNPRYLTGVNLYNLPIEEVLFFVVVPYSCTFIYACLKAYFPRLKLSGFNRLFYALLIIYCLLLMFKGWGGMYTTLTGFLALLTVCIVWRERKRLFFLPLSFVIALIPFFINGILTGTGLEEPIVWYNDAENTSWRFFTIPVEDVMYGWVLLAGNIGIYEFALRRTKK